MTRWHHPSLFASAAPGHRPDRADHRIGSRTNHWETGESFCEGSPVDLFAWRALMLGLGVAAFLEFGGGFLTLAGRL